MPRRRQELPPAVARPVARPADLPLDYAPPRTRRPRVVVGIVGWLLAGIGYAGFVLKGSQLPSYFMDMRWLNPAWRPMPFSRGQFAAAVSVLLAEMLLGLLAIAAGLGTLKMREWGRHLVLYYAAAALCLTLLKAAWQVAMFDFMLDYQQASTTQPFDRTVVGNASFFAMIVMTLMQVLWCAILASIMTRRYVRDAFDAVRFGDAANADGWRSTSAS